MKAKEVISIIRADWCAHLDFVYIEEFRPSIGWHGDNRRLDLWALHLSPGKGMHAYAFEVKVSRVDWLAELKDKTKQRMALAVSNFIFIASPKGIVKLEELPPQFGLIEIDPKQENRWERVHQIHPADYRDKVRPTWAFVASALKNYSKPTRSIDAPKGKP